MHFGAFFYGTVDMHDAGADGPPAHQRSYGQEDYRSVYSDLIAYAKACDGLGYDSFWTAEHHFHNHGFEVVPNVLLLNAVLAQHTQRIRLGALIHVLTAWHPIHFAEDYALADVLSGGRLLCGLGRGTEERESNVFGVNVGYGGNADDVGNRAVFEEQVEIFKAATSNERFAFRGRHYTIPPEGLTFRGEPVSEFPLVPRPINTPVRIYQPISSEDTLATPHASARGRPREPSVGTDGPVRRRYGALVELHGARLRPGETACSGAAARRGLGGGDRTARRGQDELTALWPNIVRRNAAFGPRPLHARGAWPQVVDRRHAGAGARCLLAMQEELGFGLVIFHVPGMH
jgi:hypothetical protein